MTERLRICPNCAAAALAPLRRVAVSRAQRPADLLHCGACDVLVLLDAAASPEAPPQAPSWLSVAYADAFYGDTGYVDRNLHAATLIRLLILLGQLGGLKPVEPIRDLGTGLGMLPRMLRDHGLDACGSDSYAAMELIRPFVASEAASYPCRTAFEVIEHLSDTAAFLKEQVAGAELFVFSTLMRRDGEIPDPDWWYYAFGNGQHITFHSRRSFRAAMVRAGLDPDWLTTIDGPVHPRALHAIAPDRRWRRALRRAGSLLHHPLGRLAALPLLEPLERWQGRRCRIIPDHEQAMALLEKTPALRSSEAPGLCP